MNKKDQATAKLSSEEKSLLTHIADNNVRLIKSRIGAEGLVFEGLEDIMADHGWQKLRQLLRSLSEKGFLISKEYDRVILCPECGSPNIRSKYACPKCQSIKVNFIELMEHPFCGYTGLKDEYILGSSLVCPNCGTHLGPSDGKPLRDGSRTDYKIIGSSFECEQCGNKFNRPNVIHVCLKCDEIFDHKTARYEKLNDYEVPLQVIKIMRSHREYLVLLIEDNLDDAKIIIRYFERSGKPFKIDHASSGRAGLEKIMKNNIDLILLDYILPDMNGIEILEEIKKRNIQTPVIMLTGADDRRTAVKAMKLGASDYIVKSLDAYKNLPSLIQQIIQE